MFPRAVFRQAYDRLRLVDEPKADRDYLGVLLLAAERGEDEVAAALGGLLRAGGVPRAQEVEPLLERREMAPPALAAFTPELHGYDELIAEVGT
jgi:hypothetical protein